MSAELGKSRGQFAEFRDALDVQLRQHLVNAWGVTPEEAGLAAPEVSAEQAPYYMEPGQFSLADGGPLEPLDPTWGGEL